MRLTVKEPGVLTDEYGREAIRRFSEGVP